MMTYGQENIYRSFERRTCSVCGQQVTSGDMYLGRCMRCYWASAAKTSRRV